MATVSENEDKELKILLKDINDFGNDCDDNTERASIEDKALKTAPSTKLNHNNEHGAR